MVRVYAYFALTFLPFCPVTFFLRAQQPSLDVSSSTWGRDSTRGAPKRCTEDRA